MSSVGTISTGDQYTMSLCTQMFGTPSVGGSTSSSSTASILNASYNAAVSLNLPDYQKLKTAESSLTDDEKDELSSMLDKVDEAAKNGTDFNPDDLVNSASDDLKSALDAQGVNLKKALCNVYLMDVVSNS